MSIDPADQNLLFAVLALQNEFVNQSQLVDALNHWAIDKRKSIGQWMIDLSLMNEGDRHIIERLVERQIVRHESVEASLSAHGGTINLLHDLGPAASEALEKWFPNPGSQSGKGPKRGATTVPSNPAPNPTNGSRELGKTSPSEETSAFDSDSGPSHAGVHPIRVDQSQPRFSKLRAHAKGGLGEVFVAIDHELGREVALKEIQQRMARDLGAQARFEMEASITGGLEHPGIVPVYGYGHHGDGRPFYAMRFIRGESLRDQITAFYAMCADTKKTPSSLGERRLALHHLLRRFVDACNAIAYAHSRGVVHRDIKPANIMLGKFGETLVVDWGLAKSIGRDEPWRYGPEETLMPHSGSSYSETIEGSVLGTPSFMSPEQAHGHNEHLTSASDVFSLGSTLYNILTGKLAFEAATSKKTVELVKINRFSQPIVVNPECPRPLNAICVKAMATRPEDRYATPLALAEDIEHFLADEIVSAYSETLLERSMRWVKTHRTLASSIAATLVAITCLSVIATLLVGREQQKTQQALDLVTLEKEKTKIAQQSESLARRDTRETLNVVTDDIVGELLARNPDVSHQDQAFFDRVVSQYESLASDSRLGPDSISIQADGYFRIGNLQRRLGNLDKAEASYRDAIRLWEGLLSNTSDPIAIRRDLAAAKSNLGVAHSEQGQDNKALDLYVAASTHLEESLTLIPSESVSERSRIKHQLANVLGNIANAEHRIDPTSDPVPRFERALSLLRESTSDSPEIGSDNSVKLSINYALLLIESKDLSPLAEKLCRSTIASVRKILTLQPASRELRGDLAKGLRCLGQVFLQQGKAADALVALQEAVDVGERLSNEFPGFTAVVLELARCRSGLATSMIALKNPEAKTVFQQAVVNMESIVQKQPKRIPVRRELAESLEKLSHLSSIESPIAIGLRGKSLKVLQDLVDLDPSNLLFRNDLHAMENNIADWYRQKGKLETAASKYAEVLAKLDQQELPSQRVLRAVLFGLADSLAKQSKFDEALPHWERLCLDVTQQNWSRYELQRAICLARTGKIVDGLKAAKLVAESASVEPILIYDAACCHAVAAETLGSNDEQFESVRLEAVRLLQNAAKAGFFQEEKWRRQASHDTDLDCLRSMPEFLALGILE
jgi:serine/threonine-protein kinase